jgi:predicted esterase
MHTTRAMRYMGVLLPLMASAADQNFTLLYDATDGKEVEIVYLFAHGLGSTQEQAYPFAACETAPFWIVNKPLALFDFPDAKYSSLPEAKYAILYEHDKVNLGQALDMECLHHSYEKILEQYPHASVVLVGVSRGAVTILNYVALYKPKAVKAIILESPFDCFANVASHMLKRFHIGWIPFSKNICLRLIRRHFPLLDVEGVCPLKTIAEIDHSIPIFIIHSRTDRTIPVNSSRNLYKLLLKNGHQNCYFLELASGQHARLLQGHENHLYYKLVHAFYKRVGLPYIPELAHQAEHLLTSYCRPSLLEITERMKKRVRTQHTLLEDEDDSEMLLALEEQELPSSAGIAC